MPAAYYGAAAAAAPLLPAACFRRPSYYTSRCNLNWLPYFCLEGYGQELQANAKSEEHSAPTIEGHVKRLFRCLSNSLSSATDKAPRYNAQSGSQS